MGSTGISKALDNAGGGGGIGKLNLFATETCESYSLFKLLICCLLEIFVKSSLVPDNSAIPKI